jgi:putative phosphonate metabolism protein
MFTRFALYYAPATGSDLARLGATWLGRDAETGPVPIAVDDIPGCRAMADLAASARRYGLHGTLKPPMRLAEGRDPDDLAEAAAAWAAGYAPVDLGPLVLGKLGRFLALVPEHQPEALVDFAADLVRGLDRFRAPPTPEELARRRQHGLTPRQEALLAEWGYPYVMEELQFHVTLTDALEPDEVAPVLAAAEAHFAPVLGRPETMADLALFAEDADGLFHLVRRLPLQG